MPAHRNPVGRLFSGGVEWSGVELVNNCRRFPDETWRTNWASSNKKRTYHRHRWRISRKAVAPCVRQQGREMQRSARTARRGAPVRSRVIPGAGRARHVARWSAVNVVVPRRAGASIQPTARLLGRINKCRHRHRSISCPGWTAGCAPVGIGIVSRRPGSLVAGRRQSYADATRPCEAGVAVTTRTQYLHNWGRRSGLAFSFSEKIS
jgi:hypothetical protein